MEIVMQITNDPLLLIVLVERDERDGIPVRVYSEDVLLTDGSRAARVRKERIIAAHFDAHIGNGESVVGDVERTLVQRQAASGRSGAGHDHSGIEEEALQFDSVVGFQVPIANQARGTPQYRRS